VTHKVPPVTSHEGPRVGVEVWLCPFFNLGARCEWVVNATPQPLYHQKRDLVLVVQEAWWASGPIWTGTEHLAPPEFEPRTVHPIASSKFYFIFCFETVMY